MIYGAHINHRLLRIWYTWIHSYLVPYEIVVLVIDGEKLLLSHQMLTYIALLWFGYKVVYQVTFLFTLYFDEHSYLDSYFHIADDL